MTKVRDKRRGRSRYLKAFTSSVRSQSIQRSNCWFAYKGGTSKNTLRQRQEDYRPLAGPGFLNKRLQAPSSDRCDLECSLGLSQWDWSCILLDNWLLIPLTNEKWAKTKNSQFHLKNFFVSRSIPVSSPIMLHPLWILILTSYQLMLHIKASTSPGSFRQYMSLWTACIRTERWNQSWMCGVRHLWIKDGRR